ncbi:solute carrier family 12 member 8-like isoform X2 [Bolinopsis microptera]|uniref:solute carrier family 12 member 8-like isoform X2 n=1 Tax=Bolinopsis microptera TaxID=2820187 RepID=UPI00307AE6CC
MANPEPFSDEARFSGSANPRPAKTTELWDENDESYLVEWWKANFFIRKPILFGTWDGVFTSCMLNIFGLVVFLRAGWMVGNAGLLLSCLIIVFTLFVGLCTVIASNGLIASCTENSRGGIYGIITYVFGAKVGATVGIMYVLGQTICIALYVTGFAEAIVLKFDPDPANHWLLRGIGIITVLLLTVVALFGVKYLVRLQLVLLGILVLAVLDFVIGCSIADGPSGMTGFNSTSFHDNLYPGFAEKQTFFTVLGVFFPTCTGLMAGVNMQGDLKSPHNNISTGSLASLAVSGFLYYMFVILLACTVQKELLLSDYMIASEISWISWMFLIGLYIASLSSILGSLYGAPRVFQCIALDNIIPIIGIFGKGRGANNEPVIATITVSLVSCCFVLVGHLNILAPITAMPFLLTYAAVNYAYFSLAMTEERSTKPESILDQYNTESTPIMKDSENNMNSSEYAYNDSVKDERRVYWHEHLQSKWLTFVGALLSVLMMFLIHWLFALLTTALATMIYFYTRTTSPGTKPGASSFVLSRWLYHVVRSVVHPLPAEEKIVIATETPEMSYKTMQLTDENTDYQEREKVHQSVISEQIET